MFYSLNMAFKVSMIRQLYFIELKNYICDPFSSKCWAMTSAGLPSTSLKSWVQPNLPSRWVPYSKIIWFVYCISILIIGKCIYIYLYLYITKLVWSHLLCKQRIGYLAAAQSFHDSTDVLMLTTNMIRKVANLVFFLIRVTICW